MKSNQGFTLLEILIAILLIGILVSVVAGAMGQLARSNNQSEMKTNASVAAEKVLDALRNRDPSTMPVTGADAPQTVVAGGASFSVTVEYCPNSNATGYCSGSARQVRAVVKQGTTTITSVDTVYTSVNSTTN